MKKVSMIVVMFLFILSGCTNEVDNSKETDKTKDDDKVIDDVIDDTLPDVEFIVLAEEYVSKVLDVRESYEAGEEQPRPEYGGHSLTKDELLEQYCRDCLENNLIDTVAYNVLINAWVDFSTFYNEHDDIVEGEYYQVVDGEYPKTTVDVYFEYNGEEIYFEYYRTIEDPTHTPHLVQIAYSVKMFMVDGIIEAEVLKSHHTNEYNDDRADNVIFNRITHSFLSESGETHSYLNVNDGNYTVYTYANPITQEYVSYSESIADSYYSAFDIVSQMYSYIAFDRNDVMTNQSITVRDGLQTILDVRIQPNSSSDKFDYSFKYNLGYVDGYDQMTFTENPFINRTSRYVIDFTKESSEVYFNPYSTIKYNYLYYSCYLAMTAEYENTILTKELYELSQTDVSFTHLTYEDFESFMNSMTPSYYKNLADVQSTKDVIIDITIQFNTDYIIE